MGKTDWKAEAKALKKEIKSLSGAKKAQKPAAKKAKPVSPLAPKRFAASMTMRPSPAMANRLLA